MKKETKKNNRNPNALASFILSLLFWLPLLNNFLAALAIVFGYVSLKDMKKNKDQSGRWMAIAGITIGIVTLIMSLIGFILFYTRPDLFPTTTLVAGK